MSCALDGSDLRLVAWGLRNAYGISFLPDGRLRVTDQGADDRGSISLADNGVWPTLDNPPCVPLLEGSSSGTPL